MKLKIVKSKPGGDMLHFKITGEMNVYSAKKLKELMLKELLSCSGITLDLSGIDEADTAGFQLLLFLKREAGVLGKIFSVTEMSGRLRNMSALYRETV